MVLGTWETTTGGAVPTRRAWLADWGRQVSFFEIDELQRDDATR